MTQSQAVATTGIDQKKEMLSCLYAVYHRWVSHFPLACSKGCASCCTQSVSMTSTEGEAILEFIREMGRENWLADELAKRGMDKKGTTLTINQYAKACLEQKEIVEDDPFSWNFTPCIFLNEGICSIYEVRPFGCRSFGSFAQCSNNSEAEIAPIHLTVNTVFSQIIEHLDSDGGYWSNMADILEYLGRGAPPDATENLQPAQPVPGFLLEPHEVKLIHDLLNMLKEQSAEKQTFSDLIDNFMSI